MIFPKFVVTEDSLQDKLETIMTANTVVNQSVFHFFKVCHFFPEIGVFELGFWKKLAFHDIWGGGTIIRRVSILYFCHKIATDWCWAAHEYCEK